MKRGNLRLWLLFTAAAALVSAGQAARAETYGGGTGEPNDPFLIYDANQMNAIGANAGDWDKHFKVMADIDLSDYNGLDGNPAFNLIGRYLSPPFTGVFDGNGHEVSNFTLAPTDANDLSGVVALGMFTHVAGDLPEIRDLTLRNVFVDGRALDMPSAALVGRLRGSPFINGCRIEGGQIFGGYSAAGLVAIGFAGVIYDCHVSCHVCGSAAGLLVGENHADIYDCTSSGSVTGGRAGGLVGWSDRTTIMSCRSDAQVTGISSGGLVGISNADIEDCAATGDVLGAMDSAGGLTGTNAGTVLRSWASGNVVCQDCTSTGGLVGSNHFWDHDELKSKVLYSFATGDVVGFFDVGGLVGDNSGTISDSYASGNVNGITRVGGLVGGNWNPSMDGVQYDNGKIYRSYSFGRPSANLWVGGLVGATGENTTVSNCFWDIQTSGMTYSDGGTGKTTTQMKTEATFTSAGWDFNTPVWQICEGVCYPSLWYQYDQPVLSATPAQLEFAALEGHPSPAGQMLSVGNCGPGTLNWQMDEDCSWLAVEPNSGTVGTFESNDVNVIPATSSLPKGDYYCELIFSDACDPNIIVIVAVDLTVAGPKLSVTPTLLQFTAAPNEPNVGAQILEIRNSGGGTLNWEITGANDCNWLSVYPLTGQSGGDVNEVTIIVDPNGLGLGFYDWQLTVSDPNATSSPTTVNVSLHVRIPGELHVPVEYSTIQSALNAAGAGETVILQPGSYDESINIPAKSVAVTSSDPHDPNIVAATILDGAGYRSVVVFSAGAGSPTLAGFTITNGANGIYAEAASPIVTNCIIEQNLGHGILCVDSDPTIVDCSITDNGGAGVSLDSTEDNTAVVINCRLLANALDGVSCDNSDLDIINCLIAGNGANGLSSWSSLLLNITNCSIVENAGTGCDVKESRTRIANSILRDNNLGQIHQTYGLLRVGFSNIEGGWGGTAVIDADAGFVAPGAWVDVNDPNVIVEPNDPNALWLEGDYRLQPGSPCIDAGDNGSLPADITDLDDDYDTEEPVPFDLDYSPRIIDGDCNATDIVDMGAHEAACACTGDFDGDCDAGLSDFAMLASAWLTAEGHPRYNPACDVALPPDGFIDWRDLKLLAENWLEGL
jgi:hypothetical protein